MYACLFVTDHLHCSQNNRVLYRAAVATQGGVSTRRRIRTFCDSRSKSSCTHAQYLGKRSHSPTPGNVARAKTGYLRRYNKGFFSNGWQQEFFVLYVDSTLAWFGDQGSYNPKGAVLLKDVCQYMAVGVTTQHIPDGPPKLPAGAQVLHLIAVPKTRSRKADFVWILCTDQNEMNSWLQTISTVLPPPPQPPQQQQGHGQAPPPYNSQPGYPPQPQPGYAPPPPGFIQQGQAPPQQGYGHPQQRPYQGQPQRGYRGNQPQTVVVNQGGGRDSGGRDFATGMLLGGAMGYGMGRPWGWGWGYGGYGYGGYGFGSGVSINNHYDIDNTNIENNYNYGGDEYGGGDYGGGDYGGGDYGGGDYGGDYGGDDFGGGDFGGGDFGGGDFDGGGDFGGDCGD